jgi:hypothetical protein
LSNLAGLLHRHQDQCQLNLRILTSNLVGFLSLLDHHLRHLLVLSLSVLVMLKELLAPLTLVQVQVCQLMGLL